MKEIFKGKDIFSELSAAQMWFDELAEGVESNELQEAKDALMPFVTIQPKIGVVNTEGEEEKKDEPVAPQLTEEQRDAQNAAITKRRMLANNILNSLGGLQQINQILYTLIEKLNDVDRKNFNLEH